MRSWVLLALLGLVAAVPVDVGVSKLSQALLIQDVETRNSVLENVLLDLIEELRETMLTGSNDIPVLDPLHVDSFYVDDELLPALPDIRVSVADVTVSKLSTFEVDSLSINLASLFPQRYRLQIEGHIPKLAIDVGRYDLSAPIMGADIFGNGDGKIDIIEPRITANILIAPRISIINGIFITITDCNIKFNLAGFDPHITGMMNDEGVNDFINLFLKNLLPEMVEFFEEDITQFLSATVMEIANDILADLNLGSILG